MLVFSSLSSSLSVSKIYLFMYMSTICMYTCVKEESIRQRRASDPTIDGCESPLGCWQLDSGPLKEQLVLLWSHLSSLTFSFLFSSGPSPSFRLLFDLNPIKNSFVGMSRSFSPRSYQIDSDSHNSAEVLLSYFNLKNSNFLLL